MLLNCGIGEDSWESLGLQGDLTSQSWRKWVLNIHWRDWCWSWSSDTLATWCKELIGKDPDAGKDWGQEEKWVTEDEMVGWHHWLSGLEFEASAGSWWWTGWPGMLQSIGSQRGGHDLVTEQQQINKCFLWLSNTEYNVLSDKNNYWEHWHDFQDGIKVHDPMVCAFLTSPTSS